MHRIGRKRRLPPGDGCVTSFMTAKKQYSQAARVQGILRTFGARHGITIGELAEEFGVNRRTIYRDLRALQDAGYPILSEVIEGTTYWKLEPSFKDIEPITFNENELMALYFSRKLLKTIEGPPFQTDLGRRVPCPAKAG